MISFLAKDRQLFFFSFFFFLSSVLEEVFLEQVSNITVRDYSVLKAL